MLDKKLELSEAFASEFLSPRLTVVITTVDAEGRVNAAPFSYLTVISYTPPRVCFSVTFRKHNDFVRFHFGDKEPRVSEVLKMEPYAGETEVTHKDTLANVLEQGEFGLNILPIENLPQLEITAGVFPRGINEIEMAGLTAYPATKIKPPLIREAKVALECVKIAHNDIDTSEHWITLLIGEGVLAHVDSDIFEGEEFRPERMRSILQFSGSLFGVCTELRHQERIRYAKAISMLP
jgi:flavin reductase (DIM6/NTAB) family NADH-FMN oxidoreductase RutF